MKTKLKFRAWYKPMNQMVYPERFNGIMNKSYSSFNIMQYTGLQDKNKKDIYCGDIIDIHQTVNGCSKFVLLDCIGGYDVRYLINGSYGSTYEYDVFELLDIYNEYKDIEIIGNIYESKELIPNSLVEF